MIEKVDVVLKCHFCRKVAFQYDTEKYSIHTFNLNSISPTCKQCGQAEMIIEIVIHKAPQESEKSERPNGQMYEEFTPTGIKRFRGRAVED